MRVIIGSSKKITRFSNLQLQITRVRITSFSRNLGMELFRKWILRIHTPERPSDLFRHARSKTSGDEVPRQASRFDRNEKGKT